MTDIASVSHGSIGPIDRNARIHGIVEPRIQPDTRQEGTGRSRLSDRVELSAHARYLDQLRSAPDVRVDRIDQIRGAIADGSYETGEKLDRAVARLIDDLFHG